MIIHRIHYAFLRMIFFLLGLFPRWVGMRFAEGVGNLLYYIGIRKRVILTNLWACFPDWDEKRLHQTARRSWIHFVKTIVEMARFPVMSDAFLRETVKFEGRDEFEPMLHNKETGGVLVVGGHLGNYEIGPSVAQVYGYPFTSIYQPARNRFVNDYLLRIRRTRGQRAITWKESLRQGLAVLARNEILATLPDQDAGTRGLFLPFFGVPASTKRGQGKIAHRSRCTVVTMFVHREEDDGYVIHLGRPVAYDQNADEKTVTLQITEEFIRRLEEMVRRYPEQYFWMHKRFKTRPPGEVPPRVVYS